MIIHHDADYCRAHKPELSTYEPDINSGSGD